MKKSEHLPDVISSHFLSHRLFSFYICELLFYLFFSILQLIKEHVVSVKDFVSFKTDRNLAAFPPVFQLSLCDVGSTSFGRLQRHVSKTRRI